VIHLVWQTAEPRALASRLVRVLGLADDIPLATGGGPIDLGTATLEVATLASGGPRHDRLAWRDDAGTVATAGRLARYRLVALGIATVDADRYALERGWSVAQAGRDPALGAVAAVVGPKASDVADPASPSPVLTILLEPDTEGRIAASLARSGEGLAALFLAPLDSIAEAHSAAVVRGVVFTVLSTGLLGRQLTVAGGPAWGPHIVIVERDGERRPTHTIDP